MAMLVITRGYIILMHVFFFYRYADLLSLSRQQNDIPLSFQKPQGSNEDCCSETCEGQVRELGVELQFHSNWIDQDGGQKKNGSYQISTVKILMSCWTNSFSWRVGDADEDLQTGIPDSQLLLTPLLSQVRVI